MRFYIGPNRDGVFAECDVYNRHQIVVLAGSTATKRELNKHYGPFIRHKSELIADGVLVDNRNLYKFTKDCVFRAPTRAAAIILGNTGAAQGLDVLKDAGGITFRRYFT